MNEIDHDYHVKEEDTIELALGNITKGYFYSHTTIDVALSYFLANTPRKKKANIKDYHLVLVTNSNCPLPLHATLASLNMTSNCKVLGM